MAVSVLPTPRRADEQEDADAAGAGRRGRPARCGCAGRSLRARASGRRRAPRACRRGSARSRSRRGPSCRAGCRSSRRRPRRPRRRRRPGRRAAFSPCTVGQFGACSFAEFGLVVGRLASASAVARRFSSVVAQFSRILRDQLPSPSSSCFFERVASRLRPVACGSSGPASAFAWFAADARPSRSRKLDFDRRGARSRAARPRAPAASPTGSARRGHTPCRAG